MCLKITGLTSPIDTRVGVCEDDVVVAVVGPPLPLQSSASCAPHFCKMRRCAWKMVVLGLPYPFPSRSSSSSTSKTTSADSSSMNDASMILTNGFSGTNAEILDDDDDDDEMDHEDYLQMMAQSQSNAATPPPAPLFVDNTGLTGILSLAPEPTAEEIAAQKAKEDEDIISPFETATNTAIAHLSEEALEFTVDNVDKVLDEVRPYLISDGGNVSVQSVEEDTGNVYLLLEGACGSCASSTVTMKMGIERVLREKFGDALGEVLQVDPDADKDGEGASDGLTMESVQAEVNRISQAIVAMGGVVRVVNVDPIGEVEIEYRGPNRVKKGLELALLDVEYVKHVKFVS
mmetsp:Transcript_23964/g.45772  ORF Transcript_23964/g.45772 Transcript_23964/m.45772 type:complete len:346 (+) Transcript_23964:563-1600(+)